MTAPESASLAPCALAVIVLLSIRMGWAAFCALRPSRRTHGAAGKVVLVSDIAQTRPAWSAASKAGLPPHLVSAARVAFWCAIGCIALLIAAVATSGGGR